MKNLILKIQNLFFERLLQKNSWGKHEVRDLYLTVSTEVLSKNEAQRSARKHDEFMRNYGGIGTGHELLFDLSGAEKAILEGKYKLEHWDLYGKLVHGLLLEPTKTEEIIERAKNAIKAMRVNYGTQTVTGRFSSGISPEFQRLPRTDALKNIQDQEDKQYVESDFDPATRTVSVKTGRVQMETPDESATPSSINVANIYRNKKLLNHFLFVFEDNSKVIFMSETGRYREWIEDETGIDANFWKALKINKCSTKEAEVIARGEAIFSMEFKDGSFSESRSDDKNTIIKVYRDKRIAERFLFVYADGFASYYYAVSNSYEKKDSKEVRDKDWDQMFELMPCRPAQAEAFCSRLLGLTPP